MGLTAPDATVRRRLAAVIRDPQFWVPVAALAAGLLVLRWVR